MAVVSSMSDVGDSTSPSYDRPLLPPEVEY